MNNPESKTTRVSSQPTFWEERYQAHDRLFGTHPDPFIADVLQTVPMGASVIDIGGGDGRNTLPIAAKRNFETTMLDFAPSALDTAAAYASAHDITFAALHADVRSWVPRKTYDVAVVAFVQLLPPEREQLYARLREAVHPGGLIVGLWFRGDHAQPTYDRIGPSQADRYIHESEIRTAFSGDAIAQCQPVDRDVNQGPVLRGHAALLHVHVKRSASPER